MVRVSLDETEAGGQTYRDLVNDVAGSYQRPLQWSRTSDEMFEFRFELDHATVVHVEVQPTSDRALQEVWRAVDARDRSRCPTSLDTVPLDVRVSTEDGALAESFVWDWEATGAPREVDHAGETIQQPTGSLRVESTGDGEGAGDYHVGLSISDHTLTQIVVSYTARLVRRNPDGSVHRMGYTVTLGS
jgi:hypothetical protein